MNIPTVFLGWDNETKLLHAYAFLFLFFVFYFVEPFWEKLSLQKSYYCYKRYNLTS